MSPSHHHTNVSHSHGTGLGLDPQARAILERGLDELLERTAGLDFKPPASQRSSGRYPLPLAHAVYGQVPDPDLIRQKVHYAPGRHLR
ncbi:MAG: hypothetical protein JXA89_19960 [Anaerolineae bacterium]|nr:hypothetical protein [Anaerolineae bacterium]